MGTMQLLMIAVFVIGYAAIAFEHPLKINKTAPALLIGAILWMIYITMGGSGEEHQHAVLHGIRAADGTLSKVGLLAVFEEASQILMFLLGAMTIVEIIDLHNGFDAITSKVTTKSKAKLLIIVCTLTFFLSAVLDNLTTSIVMVSLVRKLVPEREDKLKFLGMVIIAANAGGAWSPIGDVTTTMLWINGQISSAAIIKNVLVPSLICLGIPLLIMSIRMKGQIDPFEIGTAIGHSHVPTPKKDRNLIFIVGILGLISVPVVKTITHLPPFLCMLLALGILWVVTEFKQRNKSDEYLLEKSPIAALKRIDTSSVLFFLGILVGIGSLQATGVLSDLATFLQTAIGNTDLIVVTIGLLSAIVDNVPLVAGAMGMYPIAEAGEFAKDGYFWEFLAYAAGTGGSCLIIGSAAGVAVMGMEKIDFMWYLKKISIYSLIGYLAGAGYYILVHL